MSHNIQDEQAQKSKKKVDDIELFLDGQSENLPDGRLAILYVVFQALNKDKLAIALLDAAGYVCFGADGKQIYPPQQEHGNQEQNGRN